MNDGIVLGLPVHFREHHVGLAFREESAALHRRQLRRIAEHENRLPEGQEIAPQLLVHHGAFVDDDEVGLGGRTLAVEHELRAVLIRLPRAVDHRVNRRGIGAAFGAQHERGLARVGTEGHIAIHVLGDVLGEGRLARTGIAEETEHRMIPAAEPVGDGFEGSILLRRPGHADFASRCRE
jgi:hypothetical protein